MRKSLIFCLVLLVALIFTSTASADTRVNVHMYAIDDSVQDVSGTDNNTWHLVTTETDTSEIYNIAKYVNFALIIRADSINASDSIEFVVIPWVSNDLTTWTAVNADSTPDYEIGAVAAPSYYYHEMTNIHAKHIRFLTTGQGGNDSTDMYISFYRSQ